MNKEYDISTLHSDAPTEQLYISTERFSIPKVVAKITLCGVFTIAIREGMDWNPPTLEQIKNLKEMLNIDVELIGETDES